MTILCLAWVVLNVLVATGEANKTEQCEVFSPSDGTYLRRKEVMTASVSAANLSQGFTLIADVSTRSVNASLIKMPDHVIQLASLYREDAFRLDLEMQHPRRVITASLRIYSDPHNISRVESYECISALRLLANRQYRIALQFFNRHESALLLFVDDVLQAKCIVPAQDTSLKLLTPPHSSYETPVNTFSIVSASSLIYSASTITAVYFPRQISYSHFLSTTLSEVCTSPRVTTPKTTIILYPYFYMHPAQFLPSMRLSHLLDSLSNVYATANNIEVLLPVHSIDLQIFSQIPYPVTILNASTNYADAINAAAEAATSPSIVLLSTGIYLEADWLNRLHESTFSITGGRIYDINNKIFHSGYEFLEYPFAGATTYMLLPHHKYRGYWRDDSRARGLQSAASTSHYMTLISRDIFRDLGGLNSDMAPLFALPDLCMRASTKSYSIAVTDASAVLLDEYLFAFNALTNSLTVNYFMPLYLFGDHAVAMTAFSDAWLSVYREKRDAHYLSIAQSYISNITTSPRFTWVIHCGGSQGYEAATILQELHPLVDVRTVVRRHGSCEHSDTLSGMPVYFRDILEYTTQKTFVPPYMENATGEMYDNSIVLYARDYREIGAWVPSDTSYIIGRYMFETDALPAPWVRHCNFLDEIWVPSRWQAQTFERSGVHSVKLHVMPETVDSYFFTTAQVEPLALPGTPLDHPDRKANSRAFAFCSVFKMEDRKGWKEMVEAFVSEFTANDNVVLLLRTYLHTGGGIDEDNFKAEAIRKAIKDHLISANYSADVLSNRKPPRIEVVSEHLPSWQLVAFYKTCDAFVLSTHGEGWGLPTHEAMVMGLPVITTNWGGSTEFVTEESGLLINTTGLVSTGDSDPWLRGFKWADIDIPHMQKLMRQLYSDRGFAAEIGKQGQKYVMDHFSAKSVAQIYAKRISEIHAQLPTVTPPHGEFVMSHFDSNFGMTQQYKTCAVSTPRVVKNITRSGLCKVAIITTWEPRKALRRSLLSVCPEGSHVDIVAVRHNDEDPGVYNTTEVKFTFRHATTYDYIEAADFINKAGYEAVLVQFEFGMLYGDKLICLLRELKTDIYTTVHTVTRGMIDVCF